MLTLILTLLAAAAPDAPVAERVHEALRLRHDPGCEAILALGDTEGVRDALADATTHQAPPWAPMRAAACLTELAADDARARVAVGELMTRAEAPGLALAVTERLDALDEPVAVELARAALATHGDAPRVARRLVPRLQAAPHPGVRALVPLAE
jgi:hypothetical protein